MNILFIFTAWDGAGGGGGGNSHDTHPPESPQPGPSGLQNACRSNNGSSSSLSSPSLDARETQVVSPTSSPRSEGGEEEEEEEEETEEHDDIPALIDVIREYRHRYTRRVYSIPEHVNGDPIAFLSSYRMFFINEIKSILRDGNSNEFPPSGKIFAELPLTLRRVNLDGTITRFEFGFTFRVQVVTLNSVEEVVDDWLAQLHRRLEKELTAQEGSGLVVEIIKNFSINYCILGHFNRLGDHVPYPSHVRGGKQIMNPNGKEKACIIQCIAAFKLHEMGRDWAFIGRKIKSVPFCKTLVNMGGVETPITWECLARLEKLNRVALYVYTLTSDPDEERKHYLSLSRKGSPEYKKRIPLLLLGGKHITLIKNIEEYYRTLTRSPHLQEGDKRCWVCFSPVPSEVNIRTHECTCKIHPTPIFPSENTKVRFRNYAYTYTNSHLCFFDTEAALKPCQSGSVIAKHVAIGYSYIIVTRHGEVVKKGSYVGANPMKKFFTEVSDAWREIKESMNNFPIHMTREDEHDFQQQTHCQLCSDPFTRKNRANRHHDHSRPQHNYLAAYCSRCNLQCRNSRKYLTTFAHNMNYDVPFILTEIETEEVKILAKSSTKYFKVRIGDIQFQDSLNILNSSLASLAKSHIAAGFPTPCTREMILVSYLPGDVIDILQTQKQFMCYDYIDSLDRVNETSLPPREAFYDSLHQKDLSPEDYDHVKHIWNITNCQTLGDYVKMYCEIDVGLLADIYLKYRSFLKDVYDLDVSHYVSLPSYAYDAFLRSSQVELDCPHEKDFFYLIKRNIRGGFVTNVRPLMTANNPFINPNFSEDSMRGKYIFYLDFNSLYASAMCGHLPVGNFTKLTSQELETFLEIGISHHPTDGDKGYWLHVDTKDVSPEVARRTDDFPLCLSHLNITDAYLSPYSRELLQREGRKLPKSNSKLIASHKGLTDHLISLPLLQLLLELGLELQTIHAVYKYDQSQFLKPFIEGNVSRRKQETCTTKSRIFKLMSNAVYGRTLLSETKYGEKHTLVRDGVSFMKHVASPSFRGLYHLGKERVVCINTRDHVRITQPNYLGFQILELAKMSMYFFWYNVVKKSYGERAQLAYEDTDSFIFSLELDQNLHDELKYGPMSSYLDFSNFPPDHPLYDITKKGKLGLLKSETGAKIIKECVVLKPKMYSIDVLEGDHIARCKGIPVYHQQK